MCVTFAGLVVDADGLRLVVAIVVLDAHQVGVGAVVETHPHGQHVLVGLVHGLHQLQESDDDDDDDNNNIRVRLSQRPRGRDAAHNGSNAAAWLSLIAAGLWVTSSG